MTTGWRRQGFSGAEPGLAGTVFMGGRDKPGHDDLE